MCQRCDDLEREVVDLRRQLGLEADEALIDALAYIYGLSPQAAKILACLYQSRGRVVSKASLFDALYTHECDGDPKIVDVLLVRVRRAIGRDLVGHVWGRGIALTVEGVKALREALEAYKQRAAA